MRFWRRSSSDVEEPGKDELLAEARAALVAEQRKRDWMVNRKVYEITADARAKTSEIVSATGATLLSIAYKRGIEVPGVDAASRALHNRDQGEIARLLRQNDVLRTRLIVQEAERYAVADNGVRGLPWAVYVAGERVASSPKYLHKVTKLGIDGALTDMVLDCAKAGKPVTEVSGNRCLKLVPHAGRGSKSYAVFVYVGPSEKKRAKVVSRAFNSMIDGVGNLLKNLGDIPLKENEGGRYATGGV